MSATPRSAWSLITESFWTTSLIFIYSSLVSHDVIGVVKRSLAPNFSKSALELEETNLSKVRFLADESGRLHRYRVGVPARLSYLGPKNAMKFGLYGSNEPLTAWYKQRLSRS